jgi:hypothetical protein
MFVLHDKGKMLHMARNIFPVHEVVIEIEELFGRAHENYTI